jgi:hypothetical protein
MYRFSDIDKAFFATLKDDGITERRLSEIASSVSVACHHLKHLLGEHGTAFAHIGENLQAVMNSLTGEKYSIKRYFSAQGPIAARLKESIAIWNWTHGETSLGANRTEERAKARLDAILTQFDYNPTNDAVAIAELNGFIQEAQALLDETVFPRFFAGKSDGQYNYNETPSGYYVQTVHNHDTNVLVLRNKIKDSDVEVLLILIGSQAHRLFYYHPLEDAWILAEENVMLLGVMECLKDELTRLQGTVLAKQNEPKNWQVELDALQAKAAAIFEQEQYLPEQSLCYANFKNDSSQIEIPFNKYFMGFINTRGAYPSRTMMLYQKFGNSSNANTMSLNSENFQNLPIAMKYELVAFVNYTLDNLQDEIDAAIKKQAEAPSTPQPEPING